MHHYFQDRAEFPLGFFQGKRVLELGSGTGLGGLWLFDGGMRWVVWVGLSMHDLSSTFDDGLERRPSRALINHPPPQNKNKTKTVGITLAMLGARVVLTDLPEALDILQHNVDRCFNPDALARLRYGLADGFTDAVSLNPTASRVSYYRFSQFPTTYTTPTHGTHRAALPFDVTVPAVEPLTWGEPVPPVRQRQYDLIVGSDITYNKAAIQDLLRTLAEVTRGTEASGAEASEVYVGHLERGDEPDFFAALDRDLGFAVREVHREVSVSVGVCACDGGVFGVRSDRACM